jgi:hypothetical protein
MMPRSMRRLVQPRGRLLAFGAALLSLVHGGCDDDVTDPPPLFGQDVACETPPCLDDESDDAGVLDGDNNAAGDEVDPLCVQVLTQSCGPSGECERDPGCVAATLLARFEPHRCAEAAADPRSFPPCTLGACQRLTSRVCGAPPSLCESAPACAPARELLRRAEAGDVDAEASCAQALTDEVVFPACQERSRS